MKCSDQNSEEDLLVATFSWVGDFGIDTALSRKW